MLGVAYEEAFLANPNNWRTRSSLLLKGPKGNVLVDCAPEMRLQLLAARCKEIDAVLVTHTHADHIMGMDDLRSFCIATREPMRVYALPRYQEDIRRIFAYAFTDHPRGIDAPRFELLDVPSEILLGGMEILTMTVDHGPLPVTALRVADFAYVTDVSHIPASAEDKLQGLETLILDAVRYKPHPNHLHFDAAVEVAMRLKAKTTYFTHLSHDYDHDVVEASLPAGIHLAYDGLEIAINGRS